uniref:Cyclin-H n=1 Tax=Acrobeloides nanus TaxID=290746 RepID=A0A914CND8_9BILA
MFSLEELQGIRNQANQDYKARYSDVLEPGDEEMFLKPEEEGLLCKIVAETGLRFGDDFRPAIWPSVRWIAFTYFKRFFLRHSTMEYSPKNIMMACYYLAAKVDEFNISIDEFLVNLRSGTPQGNAETILTLEPELMLKLDYHLTVHSPFRSFEGFLIEMKARLQLGFDLEQIRDHSTRFFKRALIGDCLLLYSPSQITLAAVKYGLQQCEKEEIMKDYLAKIFEIDTWKSDPEDVKKMEGLAQRIDQIIEFVFEQAKPIDSEANGSLQDRMREWGTFSARIEQRRQAASGNPNSNELSDDDL